jgi:hypothetical protein
MTNPYSSKFDPHTSEQAAPHEATPEREAAAAQRARRRETPADRRALKSIPAVITGVVVIFLALVATALGQFIALALLAVGLPLVIWGAAAAERQAAPSSRF